MKASAAAWLTLSLGCLGNRPRPRSSSTGRTETIVSYKCDDILENALGLTGSSFLDSDSAHPIRHSCGSFV